MLFVIASKVRSAAKIYLNSSKIISKQVWFFAKRNVFAKNFAFLYSNLDFKICPRAELNP